MPFSVKNIDNIGKTCVESLPGKLILNSLICGILISGIVVLMLWANDCDCSYKTFIWVGISISLLMFIRDHLRIIQYDSDNDKKEKEKIQNSMLNSAGIGNAMPRSEPMMQPYIPTTGGEYHQHSGEITFDALAAL